MFRLLRYFSITSLVAFVVVVALLGLFYHQNALSDLMTLQEKQHFALTQAFSNSVWPQFEEFVTSAGGLSGDELRAHPETDRLRRSVLMQMKGTSVIKVKIYNLEGLTIFSTDAAQIGADQSGNAGVLAARSGQVASELTHRDTFNAFDQVIEDRDVFASYIPLRGADQDGPILGVFEIYTDVTPFLHQINRTQLRVVGGTAATLAVLYVVLFLIVRHADRTIARQAIERQRAEEQLRRQALVFENIHDSVVITALNGEIIDCNPATERIFGYPLQEVIGNHLGMWYRPASLAELRAEIIKVVGSEQRWSGEIPFVSKDGDAGVCEVVIVPLRDEQGQRLGRIWVSHDITERKRVEEQLYGAKEAAEAASQAKSVFLANMSHELRTPLTAILGYTDLLRREFQSAGYTRFIGDLSRVYASGEHLLALINDILDFSRIEAGKMNLHPETFSIAELLDDVMATVQPLVAKNNNTLEAQYAADLGEMRADVTRVRQVLLNLLSNAAKFTEQGKIVLFVTREPMGDVEWLRFGVTDTGIGITSEQLPLLFQDFTQGDNSSTRKYGGAGLGLAISRRFCEMMGGYITVASEPGVGSTFVVYLPAGAASDTAALVEDEVSVS